MAIPKDIVEPVMPSKSCFSGFVKELSKLLFLLANGICGVFGRLSQFDAMLNKGSY
jgi:hypothetical protein